MTYKLKAFQVSNSRFHIHHYRLHIVAASNVNEREGARMAKDFMWKKEDLVSSQDARGKSGIIQQST